MGTKQDATMMVTPSMVLRISERTAVVANNDKTMALTPDMILGDQSMVMGRDRRDKVLDLIGKWHVAVNTGDSAAVVALCNPKLAVGTAFGIGMLRDWIAQIGFRAKPLRWFCGGDGAVVVEQQARWKYRGGELSGIVASAFIVRANLIQKFDHFDELATALTMYGLRESHEVTR